MAVVHASDISAVDGRRLHVEKLDLADIAAEIKYLIRRSFILRDCIQSARTLILFYKVL